MPAPKGHERWGNPLKPKKYKTPLELWNKAVEYFEWAIDNPWKKQDFVRSGNSAGEIVELETAKPFTIEGLCIFLDIDNQTFTNYSKKKGYETYFGVCSRIRQIIYNQKFEGAAVGAFNHSIIERDLGLKEHVDHTTKDEPISIKIGNENFEV